MGGAVANDVVRCALPSSGGHVVALVRVAPGGTAGGVIPAIGNVVDVGTVDVVVDEVEDERLEPMNAPSVESTTTTATAPAAICLRRRDFCSRAAVAACAFWRESSRCRRSEVRAMAAEPTSDLGRGRGWFEGGADTVSKRGRSGR